jgi:large subunit ribosomal protein L21
MYAIVEIAGQQFKVEKDRTVYTHRLAGEEGAALVFDKVLLVDKDGDVTVGAPIVAGAEITGKIIAHLRGEKVLVFKKKRRKSYQKMNGHRQNLTKVLIESITLK